MYVCMYVCLLYVFCMYPPREIYFVIIVKSVQGDLIAIKNLYTDLLKRMDTLTHVRKIF